eukprot:TRINITY_DN3790_c0_g2_i1.p1 TRINITY_DN3790_c0_g2~~TRINITY_DN3790_c0_g2_i1.p1  ORF type:complete len:1211 (+),score=299.52 TRINITY_DN3790_c0_g2_i1:347-3634(+)
MGALMLALVDPATGTVVGRSYLNVRSITSNHVAGAIAILDENRAQLGNLQVALVLSFFQAPVPFTVAQAKQAQLAQQSQVVQGYVRPQQQHQQQPQQQQPQQQQQQHLPAAQIHLQPIPEPQQMAIQQQQHRQQQQQQPPQPLHHVVPPQRAPTAPRPREPEPQELQSASDTDRFSDTETETDTGAHVAAARAPKPPAAPPKMDVIDSMDIDLVLQQANALMNKMAEASNDDPADSDAFAMDSDPANVDLSDDDIDAILERYRPPIDDDISERDEPLYSESEGYGAQRRETTTRQEQPRDDVGESTSDDQMFKQISAAMQEAIGDRLHNKVSIPGPKMLAAKDEHAPPLAESTPVKKPKPQAAPSQPAAAVHNAQPSAVSQATPVLNAAPAPVQAMPAIAHHVIVEKDVEPRRHKPVAQATLEVQLFVEVSRARDLTARPGGGLRNSVVMAKLLTNQPTLRGSISQVGGDLKDDCVVQCITSALAWGTNQPRYRFACIVPVQLTPAYMHRLQSSQLVVEVWDQLSNNRDDDELIGVHMFPMNQFFLYFRSLLNAAVLPRARSPYPVLAHRGPASLTNPLAEGSHGVLYAVVAMGSMEQITEFRRHRAAVNVICQRMRAYLVRRRRGWIPKQLLPPPLPQAPAVSVAAPPEDGLLRVSGDRLRASADSKRSDTSAQPQEEVNPFDVRASLTLPKRHEQPSSAGDGEQCQVTVLVEGVQLPQPVRRDTESQDVWYYVSYNFHGSNGTTVSPLQMPDRKRYVPFIFATKFTLTINDRLLKYLRTDHLTIRLWVSKRAPPVDRSYSGTIDNHLPLHQDDVVVAASHVMLAPLLDSEQWTQGDTVRWVAGTMPLLDSSGEPLEGGFVKVKVLLQGSSVTGVGAVAAALLPNVQQTDHSADHFQPRYQQQQQLDHRNDEGGFDDSDSDEPVEADSDSPRYSFDSDRYLQTDILQLRKTPMSTKTKSYTAPVQSAARPTLPSIRMSGDSFGVERRLHLEDDLEVEDQLYSSVSSDRLRQMLQAQMDELEDVTRKLCVTDTYGRSATPAHFVEQSTQEPSPRVELAPPPPPPEPLPRLPEQQSMIQPPAQPVRDFGWTSRSQR